MIGVDHKQHERERRRDADQHEAGHPRVRRDDPDLSFDAEPIADDRRDVVEDLREIAAGLALNEHRRDEEPRVEQRDAACELFEGVWQRHPEVLLVVEQLEHRPDGRGHLFRDHGQTGRERMTRLQRARDEREGFGKLFLELDECVESAGIEAPTSGSSRRVRPRRRRAEAARSAAARNTQPAPRAVADASRNAPTVIRLPDCSSSSSTGPQLVPTARESGIERGHCAQLLRAFQQLRPHPPGRRRDPQTPPERRLRVRLLPDDEPPVRGEDARQEHEKRCNGGAHQNLRPACGSFTAWVCENMSIGNVRPVDAIRSAHFGRMPVARNRPMTFPS